MTFEKLQALARELTPERRDAELRALTNDPRFAAVLRVVLDEKELISDSACQLKFADHAGSLAHAAGARYAWLEFEGRVREACLPAKRKAPKTADED
jgi:hypothetical protein